MTKKISTSQLDHYFLTFAQLPEKTIELGIINEESKQFNPDIELFVIKETEKALGLSNQENEVLFWIPKKYVK